MLLATASEFADEYQDWLEGSSSPRGSWCETPLGEVEASPVLSVTPETGLDEVIELMNEHHRGAVLVMRGAELLGIFTERDVLRRVVLRQLPLDRTPVKEVMTSSPDVMPAWATLAQALRVMSSGSYRHLPVVDARGAVTALVSMRSIIDFVTQRFSAQVQNAPPERQSVAPPLEGG